MATMEAAVSHEFRPEYQKKSPHREPLLPITDQPSKENTSITVTAITIAKTFFRLITIFFFAVLFICSLAIILSFCVAPQKPIFQLNSLSVSNFTVSKTKLTGTWFANLTIKNPNPSGLSLGQIKSMVFYKESDALAISSVEGFDSDLSGQNKVKMKFETTGCEGDQPMVGYPVLREIEEDRKRGTVRFSIRMSVWATYKTDDKENGSLIGAGKRYCDVVVLNINSDPDG